MMGSWVAQPINQRSRDSLSLAQLPQLLSQLPPDAGAFARRFPTIDHAIRITAIRTKNDQSPESWRPLLHEEQVVILDCIGDI
jgi:hypothetical protein